MTQDRNAYPCNGKRSYPSRAAATKAMTAVLARSPRTKNAKSSVYFCQWCSGFHFGRRPVRPKVEREAKL